MKPMRLALGLHGLPANKKNGTVQLRLTHAPFHSKVTLFEHQLSAKVLTFDLQPLDLHKHRTATLTFCLENLEHPTTAQLFDDNYNREQQTTPERLLNLPPGTREQTFFTVHTESVNGTVSLIFDPISASTRPEYDNTPENSPVRQIVLGESAKKLSEEKRSRRALFDERLRSFRPLSPQPSPPASRSASFKRFGAPLSTRRSDRGAGRLANKPARRRSKGSNSSPFRLEHWLGEISPLARSSSCKSTNESDDSASRSQLLDMIEDGATIEYETTHESLGTPDMDMLQMTGQMRQLHRAIEQHLEDMLT